MRFFSPERYACLGNAVNPPYLAVGTITNVTPVAFAEFAKNNPPNSTIEFASPGGDLIAALKLGQMIRAGGYNTSLCACSSRVNRAASSAVSTARV